MTTTEKLTCPHCGADKVVQYDSHWPGLLLCLICKWLWQDETDGVHRHKRAKDKTE